MEQNTRTELNFATPHLKAEAIENVSNYKIDQMTVIINAGENNVAIKDDLLKPGQSAMYQNVIIETAETLICLIPDVRNLLDAKCPFADEMTENWTHIHDIIPSARYENVNLWRSSQHKLGTASFNLWFAKSGTDCGIHNEHNFKEDHTQIYGIGRMQKFGDNTHESLYKDVYMSPGFTSEPFYDEAGLYPYHQYFADTDCIWLVKEF